MVQGAHESRADAGGERAGALPATPRRRVSERQKRTGAQRGAERSDPTAALSLAHHAFVQPVVLDEGVPLRLTVFDSVFEAHRGTLARLWESGVLPALRRHPHERPLAYLRRTLGAFAEHHPGEFGLEFSDARALLSAFDDWDEEELPAEEGEIVVRVYGPCADPYSAARMLRALRHVHPRLGPSLLTHLGRGTRGTFGLFTPSEAWGLLMETVFLEGERGFWEEMRFQAAHDLGKPTKEVKHAELRAYVRTSEILTPGQAQKLLGRDVFHGITHPLSLEEIAQLVAAPGVPERQREQVRWVLGVLAELETLTARLHEDDGVCWRIASLHGALYARPAYVLDVTDEEVMQRRWGVVQEWLNDHERDRMNGGAEEAPNFALKLSNTPRSAVRFGEVVALLSEAMRRVTALMERVTGWEG